MGHFLFAVLHVLALAFSVWTLALTIPLHLIYATLKSRGSAHQRAADAEAAERALQVRCHSCRELVRWDATKCKHCGEALTPQAAPPPAPAAESDAKNIAIAIGALVLIVLAAKACSS